MSMKPNLKASIQSLGLSLFLVAMGWTSSGCSMMGWQRDRTAVRVVEDPTHPVSEILCLWEPAEGHDMKGLPCRGFAGQILFFSVGNQAPAEVGGEVMIYVFDDHGTIEEQQKPLHQFSFPNESWRTYLRSTNFGASYQLFIPYTRSTSEAATCNLRVRYTSPEGRITFSKIVEISLPGTPRQHPPQSEEETGADGQAISPSSLLEQLTSTSPRGADASQVSQASHSEPSLIDPRFGYENTRGSQIEVSSSQLELAPTQLASRHLNALDQLVSSLDDNPPPTAEPANQPPINMTALRTAETAVSQAQLQAPDDSEEEPVPPATSTPRSHRLHPLADAAQTVP